MITRVTRFRVMFRITISIIFFIYFIVCIFYNNGFPSFILLWPLGSFCLLFDAILIRKHLKKKKLKIAYNVYVMIRITIFVIISILLVNILLCMNGNKKNSCDYIIVLGARVIGEEPSDVLKKRIEAAYQYYKTNDNIFILASGGKGPGEKFLKENAFLMN